MAKRKTGAKLPFWESATPDGIEKRFSQPGNTLYYCREFNSLSPGAQILYCRALNECGGKREFVFPLAVAKAQGIPHSSFRRHMTELIDNGFIELAQSGRTTREKNVYRFSKTWWYKATGIEPPGQPQRDP